MSNIRFPIKASGKIKHAEVFWAEPPAYAECATLRTWRPPTGSAAQLDSAELAQLAAQKWEATCEWGTPASSFAEFTVLIRENPIGEVSAMLLVGADWFEPGLLGVCLFHRTWAKNLFLDFLAAHPATMDLRSPIRGVGTGLLFALCDISLQLKAPLLWGETTAASVSYYRDIFDLPDLTDLLAVPPTAQRSFHESTRRKWAVAKQAP
jgi:hypothetical protein